MEREMVAREREGDEQEEESEEERLFLQRSEELGAEFVRLLLGDPRDNRMGPDDSGPRSSQASSQEGGASAALSSSSQPQRPSPLGEMLRRAGDEMVDSDRNLDQAVFSFVKPFLDTTSVLQVTQPLFEGLCNRIISSIRPTNGWLQTAAAYHVTGELIRYMRSGAPGPTDREQTLLRFTAEYLLSIGLSTALQTVFQQAEQGIVEESVTFPSVDVPSDDK